MSTPGVNQTAERRLISACMVAGIAGWSYAAGEGVLAEHFSDPICHALWRAGSVCLAEGTHPDSAGLYRAIAGLDGEAKPSALEIANLEALEATSLHLRRLTADVIDLSRRRKLITAMAAGLEAAKDGSAKEWADIWAGVEPHIRSAQDITAGAKSRTLAEVAANAKRLLLTPDQSDSVPSICAEWDQQASPCKAGQLIVIAGRPGAGKSAFAGQVAHNIAQGSTTAFFSLEMSAEEILTRMARLRVNPRPQWDETIAAELDALAGYSTLRIYEVEHARTVAQIEAVCRLLAASPQGLGAVVVDYLQLVTPPAGSGRENREQQVAAMSRAFKLLARTLKVPVFLLAQLNREVDKGEKKRRPRLSDLRESGAIEQDADRVWFLYPANEDAMSEGRMLDVILYQAKCRNGPAGLEALFAFDRLGMQFVPIKPKATDDDFV
jgi:replicative DNA helicase